jgi:hypothetical protein
MLSYIYASTPGHRGSGRVGALPFANCGGGYPRLLAPPAVLYSRAGGLSGSISAGTCGCSGLGCPPLGPRSPLSLRLSGGPGSLVVALHRRRCPLLVFRIFPLLPYIRRASSRHLGLVGSSSLALPPLFGCLFRSSFSSFNSGVVSRLRAIETRTGVSILRMLGLVGSFRHGCRDRLVSRRGTLHRSLRRGPLNSHRSLSSLAPFASAGPLLGVRRLVGSCGRLVDLFVTVVSDTTGLGSREGGA